MQYTLDTYAYDNGDVCELISSEAFDTLDTAKDRAQELDAENRRLYIVDEEGEVIWDA